MSLPNIGYILKVAVTPSYRRGGAKVIISGYVYTEPKPLLHSPVVRLTCNQQVRSSNLRSGSIYSQPKFGNYGQINDRSWDFELQS